MPQIKWDKALEKAVPYAKCVKLLLTKGADVAAKGNNVLLIAAEHGHRETLALLI